MAGHTDYELGSAFAVSPQKRSLLLFPLLATDVALRTICEAVTLGACSGGDAGDEDVAPEPTVEAVTSGSSYRVIQPSPLEPGRYVLIYGGGSVADLEQLEAREDRQRKPQ